MGRFSIGQAVTRLEDPRLLRGRGRYLDDMTAGRQTWMAIVRSPHAHAEIRAIRTEAAEAAPGVRAVLTGGDYEADGLGSVPSMAAYPRRDGRPMYLPARPAIAVGRVRVVGYPVAIVVADTLQQARDAAELVDVDYVPLAAVTDAGEAAQPGAPQLYEDCEGNEAYLHRGGDADAVERAFAGAAHVVSRRLVINRITANAMEPRGALGEWDEGTGRYTLTAGMQRPWFFRNGIAEESLKIPENRLRLTTGDIGGSFGLRGSIYPEMILVLWAARRVGRPVKWMGERSEGHVSDDDARDNIVDAALALDAEGRFLAVKIRSWANLGAAVSFRGALPPVVNIGSVAGVYTIPAIAVEVSGMLTNTHSTSPYRGAGRPEAAYMIERMVDLAAVELGLDRAEIRRRNYIPAEAMPYRTALTYTYDSGRFEENMDRVLAMADWDGFEARRAEAASRGMLRGIGISNTIEHAADGNGMEMAEVRFDASGGVTLLSGSVHHGQGHFTILPQILSDRLGIDPETVTVIQGDTDAVSYGVGTGGSRSTTMSGGALVLAAERVIAKGRRIAAHLLEASAEDIEFADGRFTVAGTDRGLDIEEVARAAFSPKRLPPDMEPGLYETATYRSHAGNFPNGCHICEVEIDPETGVTTVVGYWVVDDVGTVVNPLLLEGQLHGGIVQGLGQVLMEDKAYDRATGQVLSGSFMDYAMPRADHFPPFAVASNPVPTPTNPLGVKGAGEAGTVGALPAGIGAIVDALSPLGVRHVDLPATPERVWRAIRDAREAGRSEGEGR